MHNLEYVLAVAEKLPEPVYQRGYLCWKKDRSDEPLIRDFTACIREARDKEEDT